MVHVTHATSVHICCSQAHMRCPDPRYSGCLDAIHLECRRLLDGMREEPQLAACHAVLLQIGWRNTKHLYWLWERHGKAQLWAEARVVIVIPIPDLVLYPLPLVLESPCGPGVLEYGSPSCLFCVKDSPVSPAAQDRNWPTYRGSVGRPALGGGREERSLSTAVHCRPPLINPGCLPMEKKRKGTVPSHEGGSQSGPATHTTLRARFAIRESIGPLQNAQQALHRSALIPGPFCWPSPSAALTIRPPPPRTPLPPFVWGTSTCGADGQRKNRTRL